jgi:outer membrane receptor for ferrienterochelin and colicins
MPFRFLLTLLFFVTPYLTKAQVFVVEDDQQKPVAFAHIELVKIPKGKAVFILTNDKGEVEIPTELAQSQTPLRIRITHLGFKPFTDTLDAVELKPNTAIRYKLEVNPYLLDQQIVTAQYSPTNPEKAIHKVNIIDRKKMDALGAVTLKDALQNETNIRIGQDNILGSSMSLQGISGQNVKILIDGVPMIGRLNGNIDVSQINLNNIERIEIIEGPLSVNYGTDALAGTINLITKKEQKDQVKLELNSYYETVGQYNFDGSIGWKVGKGTVSLSGGRNYFDGWSPNDEFIAFPKSELADDRRTKQWNPKEQYFGQVQYHWKKEKLSIRPYVSYFEETINNRGLPRFPRYETAFDDYYRTTRSQVGAEVNSDIGKDQNISLLAAYNNFLRHKNTYFIDLTTLEDRLTENAADQDTSEFTTWMSRGSFNTTSESKKLNYQVGYDINYESALGKRIEGKEREQGDYAAFVTAEWSPKDKLNIRPGIRATYNTAYNAPLIPSLNLRYQLKQYTLRASYAKGFRAPSLKELHFEFVDINHNIIGNENLNAETSNNFQLNVSWKKFNNNYRWKLDGGGYFNDINNLITLASIANSNNNQFGYVNIGKHRTLGFQLNSQLNWNHLSITLGGAYIGRYNALSEERKVDQYSYSPEVRTAITYDFHKYNFNLAVFHKYTGELPGFQLGPNNETISTSIADYHMLDVTCTKSFWKKRVAWTVGAKNLFDVQQINNSSTSGGAHSSGASLPVSWGTSLFTSIKFNFNGKV